MADFHIWQGAGAPHKAIKRKMDSSRKKNNFPLFKKNIFLMRQNLLLHSVWRGAKGQGSI